MKKLLIVLTICFSAFNVSAQDYTAIKNLLALNLFEKAKENFDKEFTKAKFASKAEAFILKTAIYAGLSMAEVNKNKPSGNSLVDEAMNAFNKYKEMDPEMALAKDPIYLNGPINIYSNYYSAGFNDYSKSNWEDGYNKLKNAVIMSDVLIGLKVLNTNVDTNTLVLAGITAEKSNHNNEAAMYYSRLADNKISGDGFENVYQYLVRHYFAKNDLTLFEKYKELGKSLYPNNEFFTFDRVDFAVGLAEGFTAKTKALNEILAVDPNNYKANQIMGEIIYDTLNSEKEGAVLPENAEDLEKTMVASFNKAAATKPDFEISYLYIGDHYIRKTLKINDARSAHVADMKTRTKPGTMASKEDVAKRNLLDKQYGEQFEMAREPYEKCVEIFSARNKLHSGLDRKDKEQYKKAANYLSEIAQYMKNQSKGKPADIAKYTAEEKKWNDLYDAIKDIPNIKKEN